MKIAIDFDGTCVDHKYPNIGVDAPDAVRTLKKLVAAGHQLILYTMRHGQELNDAVRWFGERAIKLHGVQRDPQQDAWTGSPKCYAEIYVDDAAFGAPLITLAKFARPCINWMKVRQHFGLGE